MKTTCDCHRRPFSDRVGNGSNAIRRDLKSSPPQTLMNNAKFLNNFERIYRQNGPDRLVRRMNSNELKCICEIIYNILDDNIPLDPRAKQKLRPFRFILRRLIKQCKKRVKSGVDIRNTLGQCGGGVFPIVAGLAVPLVIDLVKNWLA